jgi:catechol 2,3-dioxygenase-like lactoylglutathione lyase family enzyme
MDTCVVPVANRGPHQKKSSEERNEQMGILEAAKASIVISTRNPSRATAFYRDTLGLTFAYEDSLAAVFHMGAAALRVSQVADFKPHEHTILGFHVPNVAATVKALGEKSVVFNIYPHFRQDDLGILTVPGGTAQVAWFEDPDGNVLSVTNA